MVSHQAVKNFLVSNQAFRKKSMQETVKLNTKHCSSLLINLYQRHYFNPLVGLGGKAILALHISYRKNHDITIYRGFYKSL